MSYRFCKNALILLLMFLYLVPQAQNKVFSGDSIVIVENTLSRFDKSTHFAIVPGPVYNSTSKLGFVILPVVLYSLDRSDSVSPPSSTALMIYFDLNGSWVTAVKQNFFWNEDRWRVSFSGGYGNMKLRYYGIGRDTTIISNKDTSYVWMNLEGFFTGLICYRKIFHGFFAGLEYNFSEADFSADDSLSEAKLTSGGLETGVTRESILTPSFIWDTRDNIYWSVKGYYAGLTCQVASRLFLSSLDYTVITAFVNGYHSLIPGNHKLTLGWHVYMQGGSGDIPYHRLSVFGRGDNATAYTRGKYVNNSEVTVQTEIRYDLRNFLAIGGYAGTGKVFSDVTIFGQSVWLHFGGIRLYLNVIPSRNLRFRFDFAFGRKDLGFYIGIGQGF